MRLTDDNQDEMDARPLGRETGITLSKATMDNMAAGRPAASPKLSDVAHRAAKRTHRRLPAE